MGGPRNASPRPHGTLTRAKHGPDINDVPGRGCTCDPCRAACRETNNHRNRMIAYGTWQPYVDATPVREHVRRLMAAGISSKNITHLAGVSGMSIQRLLYGMHGREVSKRVRPETAARILAVQPVAAAVAGWRPVDATGTRRRLQALIVIGHTRRYLAGRLGFHQDSLGDVLLTPRVHATTAAKVRELYGELWDKPPTAQERYARTITTRCRNEAARRGWAPPLAWDDDTIDDPASVPAEGWQRTAGPRGYAELAEDAAELGEQRFTVVQIAERLSVPERRLRSAIARAARAEVAA